MHSMAQQPFREWPLDERARVMYEVSWEHVWRKVPWSRLPEERKAHWRYFAARKTA